MLRRVHRLGVFGILLLRRISLVAKGDEIMAV
jgi:hypothetical protein